MLRIIIVVIQNQGGLVNTNDKDRVLQKELLTTKDASELIGVSLPSIINWADAGRFASFRTPGGHRRIRRQDFLNFACENGYLLAGSIQSAQSDEQRIIIVDNNIEYMETLKDFLEMDVKLKVLMCQSIFEAGVLVGMYTPSVLVFDQESIPMPNKLVMFLKETFPKYNTHVVSLTTDYSVPSKKQSDNYIYLNKGKSIREVALSIRNLVASST